jgi:hypothetical protein
MGISQVMDYCKNHFIRSSELVTAVFAGQTVTASFGDTYLAGMYLMVEDSFVNNGVYKITLVAGNVITVEETFTDENTSESIRFYGCTPPNGFVALVSEIDSSNISAGIVSESIDDYSYSIGTGADGIGGVFTAFQSQLAIYRKVYDDRLKWSGCIQWR